MENVLDDDLITSPEENLIFRYAGFWVRFLAAIIDSVAMIPLIALNMFNDFRLKSMMLSLVIILIGAVYKPLMEGLYGATLGKMAMNLKVVNYENQHITMEQSVFRSLPWIISSFISIMMAITVSHEEMTENIENTIGIVDFIGGLGMWHIINMVYGFVFIGYVGSLIFNAKKQGLHDITARTYCVKK